MNNKIPSSLDISFWFCQKSERNGTILSNAKLQHLLFLSQMHYLAKHKTFLFPSLFVCDKNGFSDNTIRTIMAHGLPLMSPPSFDAQTASFLEEIWQKYGLQSENTLQKIIISTDSYKHFYKSGEETIANPACFTDSVSPKQLLNTTKSQEKIMLSQNGPVKVSAWFPRKLGQPL